MKPCSRLIAALFLIAAVGSTLAAGEAPAPVPAKPAAAIATPDQVVERGLAALVRLQNQDGGFGDSAVTALVGMALLSGGHTPTRGRYREASAKALRQVMAVQDRASGYLGGGTGNMYAHGFATLYLAECYGMAPEANLRRALDAATDLIHRAQNQEGGWRYQPAPVDADLSVTICQIMALRAAWNVAVGGTETQEVIAKAVAYVRGCANGDGSFSYMRNQGGGGGWGTQGGDGIPRAAAGSMCLIGAGVTESSDRTLGPALRFVRKFFPEHLSGSRNHYFWYGQYYAAQAMFHSPDPEDWKRYWAAAWPVIVRQQGSDGLWTQGEGGGPAYATAMALIILQIPNNYLPIFQR